MVDRIAKFFCSLRLTVVLLGAGLVLVFVGTLAQVHEGLFDAQVRYFKSWYIWKPTIGSGTWPIILPGGYLIGSLLLLNLLAAHIKRFKLSREKIGIQLIHGGLIVLLLGQLLTDALSRESTMRLSEGTNLNYSKDSRNNELVVVNTTDPASDQVVAIPESLVARKGTISNPALPVGVRILDYWPNCDVEEIAPPEAIRIDADHGGLTNMALALVKAEADPGSLRSHPAVFVEVLSDKTSLGKFLVVGNNEAEETFSFGGQEWRMSMMYAPMLGGTVLVITPLAQMGRGNMITFAAADLSRKTDLRKEGVNLTFRIKGFWPNSHLYQLPTPNSVHPKVSAGYLVNSFVIPTAVVTDMDHRNLPGALVELIGASGSLGTWLLWTDPGIPRDTITLGDQTYELGFQFKRYYEPYSVGLVKFNHDKYKGTDTAKNFSSRLRLINPGNHEDREVVIRMNSPLRYNGTTYYQGSYDPRDAHVSILEVVTNPSWLTPYFACLMVGAGLIIQFMSHLIGFAIKRRNA